PLYTTSDDPKVSQKTKGRRSSRDEGDPPGFIVQVVDAIAVLDRHNAEAAQWWRQNMPQVFKPRQLFIYPAIACELVDDLETPGQPRYRGIGDPRCEKPAVRPTGPHAPAWEPRSVTLRVPGGRGPPRGSTRRGASKPTFPRGSEGTRINLDVGQCYRQER